MYVHVFVCYDDVNAYVYMCMCVCVCMYIVCICMYVHLRCTLHVDGARGGRRGGGGGARRGGASIGGGVLILRLLLLIIELVQLLATAAAAAQARVPAVGLGQGVMEFVAEPAPLFKAYPCGGARRRAAKALPEPFILFSRARSGSPSFDYGCNDDGDDDCG